MLCNKKGLAKTSSTPGKTQTVNIFKINDEWQLADLPGYGYAKLSKKQREQFSLMIKNYLKLRENLYCAFSLVDIRIPPQDIDIEMINWMGENGVPFYIVFTKMDKLKPNELEEQVDHFKKELLKSWEELPFMIGSSSKTHLGKEDIFSFISSSIK